MDVDPTPRSGPAHVLRSAVVPFTTKDGSIIRELMHPRVHDARHQSLAEATVPPGASTGLHFHPRSEEIYHVLSGEGEMVLGDGTFRIRSGDTVCIAPGTPHRAHNYGTAPLVILCSCSPAYSDEDTVLLDG